MEKQKRLLPSQRLTEQADSVFDFKAKFLISVTDGARSVLLMQTIQVMKRIRWSWPNKLCDTPKLRLDYGPGC